MRDRILSLTKDFIKIPSIGKDIDALNKVTDMARKEVEGFDIEEFVSNGIPSFMASNAGKNRRDFKIILNAHLDVVWDKRKNFKPYEQEGRLYGRGSCDMKGAAAAMILLFKKLGKKVKYPLGLQITNDEEVGGHNCTGYQMKRGVRGDFAITGEGTNLNIVNESKKVMKIRLEAKGKRSHGAYPWRGENAILKMQRAIHRIYEAYPYMTSEWSGTTVNVTTINTKNLTDNMTPDHCEALLDARVAPEDDLVFLPKLKKVVAKEVCAKVVVNSVFHQTSQESPYINMLQDAIASVRGSKSEIYRAHGSSDARFFSEVGCDGVEFGPIGENIHAENEWVDVKSLVDYYYILEKFLLSFNSNSRSR